MKFLVVIAAFVAVAAAYPHEEVRARRSILASGALVQGPQAVLAGPSGTVSANTGAIATAPGIAGVGVAGIAAAPLLAPSVASAGAVIAPGATIVGPSSAALAPAGAILAAPGLVGAGLWGNGLLAGVPGGVILG